MTDCAYLHTLKPEYKNTRVPLYSIVVILLSLNGDDGNDNDAERTVFFIVIILILSERLCVYTIL